MKIYFAGSIRGGREDAKLYQEIIQYLKREHTVLTEHIGSDQLELLEKDQSDKDIYEQDISWLKQADLVIAECTRASLGVGYELAYAEKLNIPVYIFYRPQLCHISAMLSGNSYFKIYSYDDLDNIFEQIDSILGTK